MMISGIPYRLIHPTSQYSPGDTAEPFPKNMSPMSCDSDPGFRLTVPLFQYLENYNEAAVRQRIKNLCDYLESIQEKWTAGRLATGVPHREWRTRVAIPQAAQIVVAGFRSAHWNRLDKLRVSAAVPC